MTSTQRARLAEPLGSVTAIFAALLLALTAAGAVAAVTGSGSLGGFGNATICVAQPGTGHGGADWTSHLAVTGRPGTSLSVDGVLRACALRPGIGQRILYTMTSLPGTLVWAAVLLLLWLVVREARRTGPFTSRVALAMRRLGWLVIAGTVAATALQGLALDWLLNTMLAAQDHFGDALLEPARALVPVPLLAGAALLTFARIIRHGADLDDDLRGTV